MQKDLIIIVSLKYYISVQRPSALKNMPCHGKDKVIKMKIFMFVPFLKYYYGEDGCILKYENPQFNRWMKSLGGIYSLHLDLILLLRK
jgi:hypothetical protein